MGLIILPGKRGGEDKACHSVHLLTGMCYSKIVIQQGQNQLIHMGGGLHSVTLADSWKRALSTKTCIRMQAH